MNKSKPTVAIIEYGAGNIQSNLFALERLGARAILTKNPTEIETADKVIFPGVGEASSAMKKLKETHLDELIPLLKQPVLGICVGMQLMCSYSEEGDTKGLDIFDVNIQRFSNKVKVPQVGWNTIYNLKGRLFEGIKEQEYVYLVHSFYAENTPQATAITDYGITYTTALEKNNFYGVQFHPEKSSKVGEQILKNFLEL